ncbi:MAG: DUF4157 domain-containing protein [Anaerolineae bacterium]|nr:DUF4157 domain-containing protein [Anaerolineae bacterium]
MSDGTPTTKHAQQARPQHQPAQPMVQGPIQIEEGELLAVQRAVQDAARARPADILALQRAAGNRATSRLIQAKLTVGPARDSYEQEADRVAEQVLSMPAPMTGPANGGHAQRQYDEEEIQTKPLSAGITRLVQRGPLEEEEIQTKPLVQRGPLEEEEIQTKRAEQGGGSFDAGSDIESRLDSQKGGGQPLPDSVRLMMEPRFGTDFGGVRVHTGSEAADLNRSLSAQAFTHGNDIYLGEGKGDLRSSAGHRLIAHELTHVVQQTGLTRRQVQSATIQRARLTKDEILAGLKRISLLQEYMEGRRSLLDENTETGWTTAPNEPAVAEAQIQEDRLRSGRLRQGMTLGEYIERQFDVYEQRLGEGLDDRAANALRLSAALTSIGAAIANKLHAPYAQSEISTELFDILRPQLSNELKGKGTGLHEHRQMGNTSLNLTRSLLVDDPLGLYMQGKLAIEPAARRIVAMARQMDPTVTLTRRGRVRAAAKMFKLLSQQYQMKIGAFNKSDVAKGERPEVTFAEGHFAIAGQYGEISKKYFEEVVQLESDEEPRWKTGQGGLALQPAKETALSELGTAVQSEAQHPTAPVATGVGIGPLTASQQKYLTDLAAREDAPTLQAARDKVRKYFRPRLKETTLSGPERANLEREADAQITTCQDNWNARALWAIAFKPENIFKAPTDRPTKYKHFYDVNLEEVGLSTEIPTSTKRIERIKPTKKRGPDYGVHRYEKDVWATGLAELSMGELPRYGAIQLVSSPRNLSTIDVYGKYHIIARKATFAGRVVFALEHYKERNDLVMLMADMVDKAQGLLNGLLSGTMTGTGVEFHIVGDLNWNSTDIEKIALANGVRKGAVGTDGFTAVEGVTVTGDQEVALLNQAIAETLAALPLEQKLRYATEVEREIPKLVKRDPTRYAKEKETRMGQKVNTSAMVRFQELKREKIREMSGPVTTMIKMADERGITVENG